jgi:hypothetical protein
MKNIKENEDGGLKGRGDVLGHIPMPVVISGGIVPTEHFKVIEIIKKYDSNSNLKYYELTNKIVGSVSKHRLEAVARELKALDPNIIMEKKKKIKESKTIKITVEQYKKLLNSGLIKEFTNVDKQFKKQFTGKNIQWLKPSSVSETKFDIKKPNPSLSKSYQKPMKENHDELDNEILELVKYFYRKSNEFPTFFEQHGLTYDDICDDLEKKDIIISKHGRYELSKSLGTPDEAMNKLKEEIKSMLGDYKTLSEIDEDSNYAPGTEHDPNMPWNQDSKLTTPKEPNTFDFKVIAYNYDIAILKTNSNELYVFYYSGIDKSNFFDYAEVEKKFIGHDEDNNPDYDYGDINIDEKTIERYVNDNLKNISKGEGLVDWEKGVDLVKIDEPLKNELISLYDKNKDIVKALSGDKLEEMTSAASSGAFTPALSAPVVKKKMPVPVVKETTAQTAGNYQYHANALPDIDRDGTFKKHKKTKAEKNTQWAGGSFVEFNDCVKLNNKPAGSGCSQGAIDNVVKLKKTKSNINAPSLSESFIYEALKLQHNKNTNKLIVISDLEGKAASQETFSNKNVLAKNGFKWNGSNWEIPSDRLDVAKQTLSLINKAEYLINTLEDIEDAVEGSNADNKSLLKAKLDQYISDLANATDEAALSAEIRRYLTFFSKFHDYSFYNRILIFIQKPDATRVASYKKWQEKFRQVKKGSKAINILAPITYSGKDDENQDDDIKKNIKGFKAVNVFDISDTEPIDERGNVPETPQWWGDNTPSETADELFKYASEVASDMGIKVTQSDAKGGEKGFAAGDHINISSDVSGAGKLSTMIHEIAHELMHFKTKSIFYQNDEVRSSSALKELQAESVSYVVLKHYGLPVSHHTTYLALWKANKEKIQDNLEVISKVAQFIITKIDEEAARHEKK